MMGQSHDAIERLARAQQARALYLKTNLPGQRILELPFDAPITAGAAEAPEIFRYLGGSERAEAARCCWSSIPA